jgi:cytochrome c oxidase cbb3-type subunit IV
MDIGLLRGIVTFVSLCIFLGIVWWAYGRKNKAYFEEAGKLPFTDE